VISLTACWHLVLRREGVSVSFSMPRAMVNEASMLCDFADLLRHNDET
jgi:hypothetical protein